MYIELTQREIKILNEWIRDFSSDGNNTAHIGIYAGIKYALERMGFYYHVVYKKEETTTTLLQETIDMMKKKMDDNSINSMWNLGFASGICWTLELFNVLETDKSGVKQLR